MKYDGVPHVVGFNFHPLKDGGFLVEPIQPDGNGVTLAFFIDPEILRSEVESITKRFKTKKDVLRAVKRRESLASFYKKSAAEKLATPIDELELSVRASALCMAAKVQTLGQLVHYGETALLKVRGGGRKTVDEIKGALHDRGFYFARFAGDFTSA